jgi:RNA polymerase sigma factor (sigma-70 family)
LNNYVYDFFKSKKWKSHLKELCASEISSYVSDEDEVIGISEIVDKYSSDRVNENFNPEKELYKKEIAGIINELVSTLSDKEQLCFNLLFVDDLKPAEASLILGITPFEVSQIKYRIKEKLKKLGKDKLSEYLDGS